MEAKYFKPTSMAWWASFAALAAGVFLAIADVVPSLASVASVVRQIAGENATAASLIQLGMLGIGLRGAM